MASLPYNLVKAEQLVLIEVSGAATGMAMAIALVGVLWPLMALAIAPFYTKCVQLVDGCSAKIMFYVEILDYLSNNSLYLQKLCTKCFSCCSPGFAFSLHWGQTLTPGLICGHSMFYRMPPLLIGACMCVIVSVVRY